MPTWLLPSWAPNVHPLVIHFPIVLVQQTAERGARLVYQYGTGIIGR